MIPRQKLYTLSRSKPFLLKTCAIILAASALVALGISFAPSRKIDFQNIVSPALGGIEPQGSRLIDQVRSAVTHPDATSKEIATTIRALDAFVLAYYYTLATAAPGTASAQAASDYLEDFDLANLLDLLSEAPLDTSQRPLFEAWTKVLFSKSTSPEFEDGLAYLETHANMKPPVRFANEFLGDHYFNKDKFGQAANHYYAESLLTNEPYARDRWISLLLSLERTDELRAALDDPAIRESLSPRQWMTLALVEKDWKLLARSIIQLDYSRAIGAEWCLAVLACSIWFIILSQFARVTWLRLLIYVLAVLAGVCSATATLFAVYLQEEFGGLTQGGNWIEHTIYFIVGVGVREEVIKLIFFLPFLPYLLIRRQHAEALVTAACVGLGFALQENIGYYERSDASNAIGRFITANFLHLSLTGLLGYALYKMGCHFKRYWEEFVGTFIFVVVVHGAYDAFLVVPELQEYSLLAIILFVVIAYRFFDVVESVREHRRLTISPLAVFLIGFSILVGVSMNYVALESPLRATILAVGYALVSSAPIAFVYIKRFREE
ncbi:MAG: PrsW family glutamic-type intramembrane protease [Verrucomicrobiota bacterium]